MFGRVKREWDWILHGKLLSWWYGYLFPHSLVCNTWLIYVWNTLMSITFNESKSHIMLLIKHWQCTNSQRTLIVDGMTLYCNDYVNDLVHDVSTNNKDSIAWLSKAEI